MKREVEIKSLMTESDYLKFNFYNWYQKPVGIFITLIGIILAFLIINNFINGDYDQDEIPLFQIIFAGYIVIGVPLFTYIIAKRKYSKSKLTKDVIQYKFSDNGILIDGAKYDHKLSWELVYKIEETKNWFLIYMSQTNAHLIHKADFKDDEIPIFKSLVQSNNVRSKFKTSQG